MSAKQPSFPAVDSKWRHHRNGIVYTVVAIANNPPRGEHKLAVVYRGPNGKWWTRPLSSWLLSFKPLESAVGDSPQDLAAGNNPDRVTNAQVGKGYRLLTTEEVEARLGSRDSCDPRIECWLTVGPGEWDANPVGWAGTSSDNTYRVPVSEGSFMPGATPKEVTS